MNAPISIPYMRRSAILLCHLRAKFSVLLLACKPCHASSNRSYTLWVTLKACIKCVIAAAVQIGTLMYCLSELGLWCALTALAKELLNGGCPPSKYEMEKTVSCQQYDVTTYFYFCLMAQVAHGKRESYLLPPSIDLLRMLVGTFVPAAKYDFNAYDRFDRFS